jgi:hypothetical protein
MVAEPSTSTSPYRPVCRSPAIPASTRCNHECQLDEDIWPGVYADLRMLDGGMEPADPQIPKGLARATGGNFRLTKTVLEGGLLIAGPHGWRLDGPLPPFAISGPGSAPSILIPMCLRKPPPRLRRCLKSPTAATAFRF